MSVFPRQLTRKVRKKVLTNAWRVRRALFPGEIATFTIDPELNLKIQYPLNTSVGYGLFVGDFETMELDFVRKLLKPGDVVFDVGANAGVFTVLAGTKVGPKGRVCAFEPGTEAQALLKSNLRLNRLSNVTLFEGAVSDRAGTAKLAVAEDGALSSLARTGHHSQMVKEWREVPTTTLDDFVEKNGIAKIDFIKIDVEGAEKLVFEGARRLLKSFRGLTVLFEAYDLNSQSFGYSVEELLTSLRRDGIKLSYFGERGELVPIDRYESHFGREIYNFVAQT